MYLLALLMKSEDLGWQLERRLLSGSGHSFGGGRITFPLLQQIENFLSDDFSPLKYTAPLNSQILSILPA